MIASERDILIANERIREIHREAASWRAVSGRRQGVSANGGGSSRRIDVRWALAPDVEQVGRILELNDVPRHEASEGRFVVAVERGIIRAVVSARVDGGRLALGRVFADLWGGEGDLSVAIYREAVVLARSSRLDRVTVKVGDARYLRHAGYVRWFGGWCAGVAPERGTVSNTGFGRLFEVLTNGGFAKPRVPGL